MEMKIWKWQLSVDDTQNIKMPKGARILSVGVQHGNPVIWALVNPNAKHEPRTIYTRGTGRPALDVAGKYYVGTYQLVNGNFIGHVFCDATRYSLALTAPQ